MCSHPTCRYRALGLLGPRLQLSGELFNELPEEVRVAVLGELVEHEPVAQLPLGEDEVQRARHVLVILAADLAVEEAVAHPVEHEGDQAVAEVEHGDGAQEHVPEPEHQVDLLVDDVLGEDAQPVVELQPHSNIYQSAAAVCTIRLSRTWATPEAPTLGMVQLVTVGNTVHIGFLAQAEILC